MKLFSIINSNTTFTTQNSTHQNLSYNHTTELDWIFPMVVNVMLMVVHFWLIISLMHYGIKNKKWQKTGRKSDVLNCGLVYASVIGCAIAGIFRLVMNLLLMNIGFSIVENGLCSNFFYASSAAYGVVHLFIALFLWSRQRSFFANKLLNFNYSRPVRYFSSYVIAFILGFGVFALVYNRFDLTYVSSRLGCVRTDYEVSVTVAITPALVVIFYNVALLGLLTYALTRANSFQKKEIGIGMHLQQQEFQESSDSKSTVNTSIGDAFQHDSKEIICAAKPTSTVQRSRQQKPSSKIIAILRRTLFFAVLSILVDASLQILIKYIPDPNLNRRITNMCVDIATLINLLLVILSFTARKEMMTSPCKD